MVKPHSCFDIFALKSVIFLFNMISTHIQTHPKYFLEKYYKLINTSKKHHGFTQHKINIMYFLAPDVEGINTWNHELRSTMLKDFLFLGIVFSCYPSSSLFLFSMELSNMVGKPVNDNLLFKYPMLSSIFYLLVSRWPILCLCLCSY